MEQLHGVGRHQFGGEASNIGFASEAFELGDAPPIDIVVPETARRSGRHVLGEVLPRGGLVLGHPDSEGLDPVGEHTPQDDSAVPAERLDQVR